MEHIETTRRAQRLAVAGRNRRRRTWAWVIVVILVNLVLLLGIVVMADVRLVEMEVEIEKLRGRKPWQGELATARGELGAEITELRSELAELRGEVGADEAARSGLVTLGGRVERIEEMITVLWRSPINGARGQAAS